MAAVGSKHVCIRPPTPGTPPPLDTIVGEASPDRRMVSRQPHSQAAQLRFPSMPIVGEADDEPAALHGLSMPIVGKADDEPAAYHALPMPVVGEAEDEPAAYHALSMPIVGEAEDEPAAYHALSMPIVGEAEDDSMLPCPSDHAEGSRMNFEEPSAPSVQVLLEDAEDSASALAMPIVGEAEGAASPSATSSEGSGESGMEEICAVDAMAIVSVEDGEAPSALEWMLPVVGEAADDSGVSISFSQGSHYSDIEDPHSLLSSIAMPPPSLEGVTIATPTEDGTTSPPLSTYSGSEETSPACHDAEAKTFVHQHLSHLRSKQETISATIEALQEAEATARVLQDSPFSTSPQYWRVYQISLLRRVAGVDDLWEDLQQ
ncbi:hypothetical protein LXA43DRAFT_1067393 [Ganoderma leucocontextum]|nr:hypothetical protein LXA43DRAFT_1067393 [Ganoderma leucocontextum]